MALSPLRRLAMKKTAATAAMNPVLTTLIGGAAGLTAKKKEKKEDAEKKASFAPYKGVLRKTACAATILYNRNRA